MATEVTFVPPAALAEPLAAYAATPATSASPASPDPRRVDVRCMWILLLVCGGACVPVYGCRAPVQRVCWPRPDPACCWLSTIGKEDIMARMRTQRGVAPDGLTRAPRRAARRR